MSTSAGGSSPLVSRAWRCGIGGEILCLLTTLSRYLERSKDISRGSTSHSQVLGQSPGLGVLQEGSGVSAGALVRQGAPFKVIAVKDLAAH